MGDAVLRQAVVAVADSWVGTPFQHQASRRQVGCDCLGLVRGVLREVMGAEPCAVPAYAQDTTELAADDVLYAGVSKVCTEIEIGAAAPGDLLLFRMRPRGPAQHLGILTAETGFVHAYARSGVVRSDLSPHWRRKLVGVFEIPVEAA